MSETSSNEQDRSQVVLKAMFNGDKTYDNRTEEIQRNRELLIENRTTGLQAQVSYRDKVQEASVTRAAVRMGMKGWGCEQDTGAHTISLRVGIENRYVYRYCGSIIKVLACNKIEIE